MNDCQCKNLYGFGSGGSRPTAKEVDEKVLDYLERAKTISTKFFEEIIDNFDENDFRHIQLIDQKNTEIAKMIQKEELKSL